MPINNAYEWNMNILRKMINTQITIFIMMKEREPNEREIKHIADDIREENKVICPVTDEQFNTILYGVKHE
jgi:hypothetical protein